MRPSFIGDREDSPRSCAWSGTVGTGQGNRRSALVSIVEMIWKLPSVAPSVLGLICQRRCRHGRRQLLAAMAVIWILLGPSLGTVQPAWSQESLSVTDDGLGDSVPPGWSEGFESLPWDIVVVLTLITFVPALLITMTPFARFLVIFHFLRQALSTQSTPSNQTLIGIALFLTYFVMQPVGADMHRRAIVPWQNNSIDAIEAVELASVPLREFMLRHTREKDMALFVEMTGLPRPSGPEDLPMRVVAPAYILSELKTGFQIGLVLFLPFLVIDMVVASVTTSVGMMQLPPVMISTPLKILLFVMVDGWNLVVGSMLRSFN